MNDSYTHPTSYVIFELNNGRLSPIETTTDGSLIEYRELHLAEIRVEVHLKANSDSCLIIFAGKVQYKAVSTFKLESKDITP